MGVTHGSKNLYIYAYANPLGSTDPSGRVPVPFARCNLSTPDQGIIPGMDPGEMIELNCPWECFCPGEPLSEGGWGVQTTAKATYTTEIKFYADQHYRAACLKTQPEALSQGIAHCDNGLPPPPPPPKTPPQPPEKVRVRRQCRPERPGRRYATSISMACSCRVEWKVLGAVFVAIVAVSLLVWFLSTLPFDAIILGVYFLYRGLT